MTILGGCQTSSTVALKPNLPEPPARFGRPVPVPPPQAGQGAKAYAAKAVGGLRQANTRLLDDRAFYDKLRGQ